MTNDVRLSLRISKILHSKLIKEAKRNEISVNAVIKIILNKYYMSKYEETPT